MFDSIIACPNHAAHAASNQFPIILLRRDTMAAPAGRAHRGCRWPAVDSPGTQPAKNTNRGCCQGTAKCPVYSHHCRNDAFSIVSCPGRIALLISNLLLWACECFFREHKGKPSCKRVFVLMRVEMSIGNFLPLMCVEGMHLILIGREHMFLDQSISTYFFRRTTDQHLISNNRFSGCYQNLYLH